MAIVEHRERCHTEGDFKTSLLILLLTMRVLTILDIKSIVKINIVLRSYVGLLNWFISI